MALVTKHKDVEFGIGDTVKVYQTIVEGGKKRLQPFEGMVIKIKGREENRTFTVRRVGVQRVGIEKIFPISAPTIERVEVLKFGTRGIRRAKLYYTRDKSTREIERIYSRAKRRRKAKKSLTKKT
jgi:large subunit ribosomal protein L19